MEYIKHKAEESMEDYLEAILMIQNRKGNVRSIDIAAELGFTKPSVSVAMKSLREKGYITMAETGYITLTEEGMKIASDVLDRHIVLSSLLMHLGVSKEVALEDACKTEHDISKETFDMLKKYYLKIKDTPAD